MLRRLFKKKRRKPIKIRNTSVIKRPVAPNSSISSGTAHLVITLATEQDITASASGEYIGATTTEQEVFTFAPIQCIGTVIRPAYQLIVAGAANKNVTAKTAI